MNERRVVYIEDCTCAVCILVYFDITGPKDKLIHFFRALEECVKVFLIGLLFNNKELFKVKQDAILET